MWRRNAFTFGSNGQENEDSDQSISEEEEGLEGDWTRNAISLGGAEDKGGVQLLSQLELLRDSYELHTTEKESISSHERKGGYPIDDEVEHPLFNDGDGSSPYPRIASPTAAHSSEGMFYIPTMASISHSDEEIISDDENLPSPRSSRLNIGGTWSEASQESEALVWLNEHSGCSSSHGVFVKENNSKGTGSRTKSKSKLLFHFHSRKEDLSLVVRHGNVRTSSDNIPLPDEIGAEAGEDMDNFKTKSRLIFHENKSEQQENDILAFELANKHNLKEYSMAEFLDCFQERSDLPQESSELTMKKRGRRAQKVLEGNMSTLGDRNLDGNDLSGALDSDPPICSNDEENPSCPKMIIPGKTMADQFHEAFGTVSVIDESPYLAFPRPLCSGIHGKLQQVMQSEKEKDMDYLKNISAVTSLKDEICISVRILSRSLEAKLVVCFCTCIEAGKNSYWENNLHMKKEGTARTLTIIFNPRLCGEVELEVGSLIRIHPPWKEAQVKGKDELVLLCSYFSQVQS